MPIYAYRCGECGHQMDVLQKLSDPPLSTCPACGADAFAKQVTAAGFQLKGSGWYATDFKGSSSGKGADGTTPASGDKPGGTAQPDAKPAAAPSSAAPAGGCGGSCACH